MMAVISVSALLAFGVIYPLFLFTQYRHRVGGGFSRIQLGLAVLVGGLGVAGLMVLPGPPVAKAAAGLWLLAALAVAVYGWKQEAVSEWLVAASCLPGLAALVMIYRNFISRDPLMWLVLLLGGAILAGAIFCMNLGHWHLKVRKLSIKHLTIATRFFALLLAIRLIWDLGWLMTNRIQHEGYYIALWQFFRTTDGFLLSLTVLCGTLLPLLVVVIVLRTLRIRATASATGLLYVIVVLVLMGELAYRYYQVSYGILL